MSAIERAEERRSAEVILAEWRSAERRRDGLERGSPEWVTADRAVDELRREYQETVSTRIARHEEGG